MVTAKKGLALGQSQPRVEYRTSMFQFPAFI